MAEHFAKIKSAIRHPKSAILLLDWGRCTGEPTGLTLSRRSFLSHIIVDHDNQLHNERWVRRGPVLWYRKDKERGVWSIWAGDRGWLVGWLYGVGFMGLVVFFVISVS